MQSNEWEKDFPDYLTEEFGIKRLELCSNCSDILVSGGHVRAPDLRITMIPRELDEPRHTVKLCSDLVSLESSDDPAQVGFLVLPHPLRFALLRIWLQRCDDYHDGCKRPINQPVMPTRLIHVVDSDNVRLVSGKEIQAEKYIALSHCWGKLEFGTVPEYCTTISNISVREKGFKISDLPQTFQDAIEVARELEVHYLWIDSLCIKQGPDGDWKDEARRMEGVYSSAYCTIAATSAIDSKAGFLKRDATGIDVREGSEQHIYLSIDKCDFDTEVEQATLNKRAWVMQERLLSCRTIHFGAQQMYFECGDSVCCEDLSRLKSSTGKNNYFKIDPNFPDRLRRSGYRQTISFLQFFLEDYSRRCLSKSSDRAVAISGLAQRIAKVLSCKARHGVFELFFHRNLLWQRSDVEKIGPIKYEEFDKVPSWSWMAYPGGIKFIELDDVNYGMLDLNDNLKFDQDDSRALITDVCTFQDCHINRKESFDNGRYEVLDSHEVVRGWVIFDVKHGQDFDDEQVVVIGRTCFAVIPGRQEYHILVVGRKAGSTKDNEYERVGIGRVQVGYLSWRQSNVRVI